MLNIKGSQLPNYSQSLSECPDEFLQNSAGTCQDHKEKYNLIFPPDENIY